MPLGSATGILDVTNATLRSKKLVATEDITTADLNVSGTFSVSGNTAALMMSEIQSNTQTMIDFTDSDQLVKFPRETLTSASQNGHVVSTPVANSTAWKAFNEVEYASNDRWFSTYVAGEADRYSLSTGYFASGTYDYTLSNSSGTPNGDYLSIQFPQAFVLHSFAFSTRSFSNLTDVFVIGEAPRDFQVWGSNDGSAWTKVFEIEDAPPPSGMGDVRTFHTSGITAAYNRYAIIVTRNGAAYPRGQGRQIVTIGELRYYGYEQYASPRPGQDIVFKHHANVPTKDFLQVYWDANESNSYPGSGADVTDIATASSNTVPGALSGSVAFDTTSNAWTFDGDADFIEGTLPSSFAGDQPHTVAFWFKRASNHDGTLFTVSPSTGEASQNSKVIQVRTNDSAGYSLSYIFWSNDIRYNPTLVDDTWYHLVATYAGGGGTPTKKLLYLNGALLNPVSTSGSVIGNALAVDASSKLRLGSRVNHSSMNYLNGAVASFRLYTRPLIKEQIETLYDYEKVRFGHVSSLDVTLHKGSVGVGVAEPSRGDRLAVAGRVKAEGGVKTASLVDRNDVVVYEQTGPHDRPLVKYPEVPFLGNGVLTQNGYTASASGQFSPGYHPSNAFVGYANITSAAWVSPMNTFTTTAPYNDATSSNTFNWDGTTVNGPWLKLELIKPMKMAYSRIYRWHASSLNTMIKDGYIYGSNDDTNYTRLVRLNGLGTGWDQYTGVRVNVNATDHFKYYVLQTTAVHNSDANSPYVTLGEWELYGTEQGDVSTDSTWTSVLNKPGTQHLEVYWDGADSNSYPGAGTDVFDLSGNGVKGTITGNNGFDSTYNAWNFDGSGDYISTTNSGLGTGGAFDHSLAFWFRINRNITNNDYVVTFGEEALDNMIAVNISANSLIHFDNWGRGVITGDIVRLGIWYHVACTHTGSATGNVDTQLIYVNGVKQSTGSTGTGTLAFTSDRITIGARPGTNNSNTPEAFLDGAVANVRFFKGKVLNAAQVKELYAYDAVRFGHRASNSVTLYKGNLGLGVTEPTSRLEIAGDERIQEYPPRAMTDYETYIEGHGVFRASQSSPYPASNYNAWKVFDKSLAYGAHFLDSYSSTNDYIYDGAGTRSDGLGGIAGEWVKLEMPYAINLKSFAIAPASLGRAPEDFVILGSNDDTLWTQLANFNGLGSSDWSYSGGQYLLKDFTVPNTKTHYKYFAIVVTRTESNDYLQIDAMVYYGTPAPSSLEDGHLTLGKALTLPRVSGHPTGAETPRAESLVVHYDTTVDSVVSGSTVVDTSGNGLNGALENGSTYSSSLRAFQFDGTNDWLSAPINNSGGAWVHSMSFWFKFNGGSAGGLYSLVHIGAGTSTQNIMSDVLVYTDGKIRFGFYANDSDTATGLIDPNIWYHVVCTYNGGAGNASSRLVYINGQSKTLTTVGAHTSSTLNLPASTDVYLGSQQGNSSFPGSISNFKLWDVALTTEEVAMEYALGRTGKALNVTDTAVCIGGTVPRAQLDVRGSARFEYISDKLHVDGDIVADRGHYMNITRNDTTGGPAFGILNTDGSYSGWFGYGSSNKNELRMVSNNNYPLTFWTSASGSGVERMRIAPDGKVGVGTNNPHCKLDVQGGGTRCSYPFGIGQTGTYATYTHTAVGGIANNAGSWTKDFVVGSYERGGWIRVYSGATKSGSAANGQVQNPKTAEFVYSIYGNSLYWNRVSGSTNISLSSGGYQTIRVTSSGGGSYNHGWVEIWQQGGVAIF